MAIMPTCTLMTSLLISSTFHTFWKQLFAYRNDGEYTLDNLVEERTIRNMTIQRKNSLFFCSDVGAWN